MINFILVSQRPLCWNWVPNFKLWVPMHPQRGKEATPLVRIESGKKIWELSCRSWVNKEKLSVESSEFSQSQSRARTTMRRTQFCSAWPGAPPPGDWGTRPPQYFQLLTLGLWTLHGKKRFKMALVPPPQSERRGGSTAHDSATFT